MHLHCLGTAGYHPNEHRHTSCYFIPEASLLLDAGTGLFRIAGMIQSSHIDVLLSHAHLDHVIGLTYFLELLHTTPLRTVTVYGEAKKLEAIQKHLFAELIFPVLPNVKWVPLESTTHVGTAKLRWSPLVHPGGSVGYRLDWEKHSLAYITDTTSSLDSDYWRMVEGVDSLLHECNFLDSQKEFAVQTGHSWPSVVIEGAKKARVKKLILTHFDPLMSHVTPLGDDQAGISSEELPVEIASDRSIFSI